MDFLKNRSVATVIAFFLWDFLCTEDHEAEAGIQSSMDGILTMPLVLPPTVAGFFLLLIFSLRRPFGNFLLENFDIKSRTDMERLRDRSCSDRISTDVPECTGCF